MPDLKQEKPGTDKKAETKLDLREKYKKTYREKAIVIKIMPRTLERFIFAVVIIILLVVFLTQKGCDFDMPSFDFGGDEEVSEGEEVEDEAESEDEAEAEADPEPEPKPLTEEQKISIDEIKKDLSFDFNVESEGKKITSITFTITNGDVYIMPRVKAFWYDPESTDTRKNFERGSITYMLGLNPGQTLTKTFDSSTLQSKYFESTDPDSEIVELKLYDMKSGNLILSKTKPITSIE